MNNVFKKFHILEQVIKVKIKARNKRWKQEIKVKMEAVVLRRNAVHKVSERFSTDTDVLSELKDTNLS